MRILFFIFAFLCFTLAGFAQHSFKTYSSEHGFPDASVNALCEDQRGHLWIATAAGLVQFDGFTFSIFRKADGLPGDDIRTIYEDNTGDLWIGTDKGLCIYDGHQFKRVPGFDNEVVQQILPIERNVLLVHIEQKGLFRFNKKERSPFSASQITGASMHTMFQGKEGELWVGSGTGLGRFAKDGNRIFTKRDGLLSESVLSITTDHNQRIWAGTTDGLYVLDQDSFVAMKSSPGMPIKEVFALAADRNNHLWLGTANGLLKYDGKQFTHHVPYGGQGKVHITCMLTDHAGNLWVGSAGHGLSRLERARFTHFPESDQMGKRIYSVVTALNGNIMCGTSLGGITVFDGKNYSLLDKREGFTSSVVQCFYYGPDSSLWVGTQDDGLFRFDKSGTHHYTREDGLSSNDITGITRHTGGEIWLGTGDRGVMVLKMAGDSITSIKSYDKTNGLPGNVIYTLLNDGVGSVWVGTAENGLIRFKENADTVAISVITVNNGLSSNTIHTLQRGESGRLFAGTTRGICVLEGDQIVSFSKADGLRSNMVYSLTTDLDGNLWAGTDRGIDRIVFSDNFRSISVRHFGSRERFYGGEVYRNASCTDRDGNVWFGTLNGLVRYHADEGAQRVSPRVHLTGMRLFFDRIEHTPYIDSVTSWYPLPIDLVLPHNQNNVTISYVGIHHSNPDGVRYKWMLEGFSPEWTPPIKEQDAIFSNLPPGKYTFHVLAADEDNRWSEMPASISFTIASPWWQWWWVRVIFAGLIFTLIWMIFYVRLRQVKARNKVVQERLLLENQVLELEQEASRLQMNPHFIFNCLNSIQGLITSQETVLAKKSLTRFGKLMRLILENAREEFIPLENEIQMLTHYLDLENITTGNPFMYSITTDEGIDPAECEVPPMMIQPFVENAVLHGLRKKQGPGRIDIHFSIQGNLLVCVVTDNGIGREASAKHNRDSRPHHTSTAIAITRKRLEQYGRSRNVDAGVTFVDLVTHGEPSGTQVRIAMPY